MGELRKILGQAKPSATVLTDLYTPITKQAIGSTILVCNLNTVADIFRISVAPSNAADTPAQYIYYDVLIPGNETFASTIGITLGNTDVIRVYSNNGTCSFTLFGIEIT